MIFPCFLSPSSSTSSIDDEATGSGDDLPSIGAIYTKAEAYNNVLNSTSRQRSIEDPTAEQLHRTGYTRLVSDDLTPSERAELSQANRLVVANTTWTPEVLTEEPVSFKDGFPDSEESNAVEKLETELATFHRPGTTDSDAWKLEPEEIIRLLLQEFGPLAVEGESPEKLILEADACMFNGVVILGVVHLTTYRIVFHASLLGADQSPAQASQKVIKAGSVTVHRKGWRTKQRVWIELYSDMLITCASSSEEDRIRPLRTVLLSNIKSVLPHDDSAPCALIAVFNEISDRDSEAYDYAEFDTPEACQDWRREILGALFLYRHRRRDLLDIQHSEVEESDSGIRISCPLDRITKFVYPKDSDVKAFSTFHVKCALSEGQEPEECIFHLCPLATLPAWERMDEYIIAAKKARQWQSSPFLVDFGSLNMAEDTHGNPIYTDEKEKQIRHALGLDGDVDLWIARASLFRSMTRSGSFVVSDHHVAYWSKTFPGNEVKYRLHLTKIRAAKTFRAFPARYSGLALEVIGQSDLKFHFRTVGLRDEALKRINLAITTHHDMPPSPSRTPVRGETRNMVDVFSPTARAFAAAKALKLPLELHAALPKVINIEREVVLARQSMHFMCLTIGSRGDVQPYIALGLGLMKEHHKVTIVTHEEYKEWVESFGIGHQTAGGDPGALMKLSVENKMFSPEFFKESLQNFRPWLDQLLLDAWEACQDADVLLESPSAMAGVHIAEALNIPYFRTFTMPWTKTAEFPHAFLSPPVEYATFNSASYVLFSNVMWTATSGQINRWRRHTLKIGSTDMGHLAQSKIPFVYNFSQAVVPKPLDWSDSICVSGYWFLDNPEQNWTAPETLIQWMSKAREDKKPIVYIGFGSITVPHPNRVTARIIKAVVKSGVRAIISKGWSARMSQSGSEDAEEPEYPPECYPLEKIPHDWLFPRIDAALHHGGAGTTGASLRAGIPTLIKPWFGDQFFWASRVQKLGAGLKVPSLQVHDLAEALTKSTTSRVMKEKAAAVGKKIRSEDGVRTAIHTIYTYLPRASQDRRTLRKERSQSTYVPARVPGDLERHTPTPSGTY